MCAAEEVAVAGSCMKDKGKGWEETSEEDTLEVDMSERMGVEFFTENLFLNVVSLTSLTPAKYNCL